jgi:chromosomal replication initiation ATPase DnaA
VIIHAHLQPDHPAVVARRSLKARMALAVERQRIRSGEKEAEQALARCKALAAEEARLAAEAAAQEARNVNGLLRTWRNEWKPAVPIIRAVCARHGFSISDLVSPSKTPALVECRQEAMALVVINTSLSFPAIGKMFRRHHATVIHAARRWNEIHGTDIRGLGQTWRKASSYAYRGGA